VVHGLVLILRQVEYQEVFRLINYKELTEARHEFATSCLGSSSGLLVQVFRKEERTPL
jgi:hypothetical protein